MKSSRRGEKINEILPKGGKKNAENVETLVRSVRHAENQSPREEIRLFPQSVSSSVSETSYQPLPFVSPTNHRLNVSRRGKVETSGFKYSRELCLFDIVFRW